MESKNKARQKYNFSFQLRVIKFAEEKGKHAAAKFFNVDRKVTVANSLPPLLRKKINTLLCSMGTCPTHCSLFPSFRTSFTANLSFGLFYSLSQRSFSLTSFSI
jgi:hypothetical protein